MTLFLIVLFLSSCAASDGDTPAKAADTGAPSPIEDAAPETSEAETEKSVPDETSYQSILDEYTIKLQAATPRLIDEYMAEAAENEGGITGLAEISNSKIFELAEISNEGIMEMANYMYSHGSGKYSEYEEWATLLQDVYMEEAAKITDAYIKSAL